MTSVIAQNYSWGIRKIKILQNGDICLFGNAQVPTFGGFGVAESPFFILLNSEGIMLWSNMYQLVTHSFQPEDVCENTQGNLIFVGSHRRQDAIGLETISGIGTILLDRQNGSIIGSGGVNTNINIDSELSLNSFFSEDRIIVASSLNIGGISNNQSSTFLFKLNNDASLNNSKRIDATDKNNAVMAKIIKKEGQYYYLAGSYSVTDTISITTSIHPFCALADLNNASTLWAKKYGNDNEGKIDNALIFPDNGILLSGWSSNYTVYLWKASKTSGNAACLSENVFIQITDYQFNDSVIVPSLLHPDFITSGYDAAIQNNVQVSGNISSNEVCIENKINETINLDETINVFPNPANQWVTIKNSIEQPCLIEFIDAYGKTVFKIKSLNGKEDISVSDLKKGIYLVRIINTKGSIYTPIKSVKLIIN